MGFFKKDSKEARYVGGEKHWAEVIENVGMGGDMISLHPDEDFNTNSTLIVHPGEQAIFEKNGQIQQVFQEGRYQLKTENYPFISRLRNAFTGGVSTFNCRVYFLRTATSMEIKWGTGEIQVRDKKLRVASKVYARGAYRVKVGDGGKFLFKLIGNNIPSFEPEEIENYFRHEFLETIKTELANALNNLEGEILGIQSRQKELSNQISPEIAEVMEDYGIELLKLSISAIEVDMDDEVRRQYEAKLGNASADSEVMDILGDKWAAQQQIDIMKSMAANQGNGGIGAAVGMGMAGVGSFFGMGQQAMNQQSMQTAPPPMPQFYLFINNQQVGPIDMQQMSLYVQSNQLTPDTLVWKNGMAQWAAAKTIPELQQLFITPGPPPPPMPPMPPTP
ncbi:MAG: SPFH domain-containing protein [Muribaculaceae bacterium]|nr:SPFH domain-containing protein [Muribaculaceae bacterium]